jgi:hypothetical protein
VNAMSTADVVYMLITYHPERIQPGCTREEIRDIAVECGVDEDTVLEAIEEAMEVA